MKEFKKELYYKGNLVKVVLSTYSYNKTDAIMLLDEEGLIEATATICLDDVPKDHVAIKDYSENSGIYDWLLSNDIIYSEIGKITTGYAKCPIVKIKYENFIDVEDK